MTTDVLFHNNSFGLCQQQAGFIHVPFVSDHVIQTHVSGEGATHELLPLSILGVPLVAAVLEVPQACLEVLDVVLELVRAPAFKADNG